MKRVTWKGRSKDDLKSFPSAAMDNAGYQIFRVQCGLEPMDWKPMPTIGAGVKEIRIRETGGAYRVIYLATRQEAIYVLHCFQKKTEKTSPQDLQLARDRLKSVLR